jgi:hypothetical protein
MCGHGVLSRVVWAMIVHALFALWMLALAGLVALILWDVLRPLVAL